MVMEAEDLVQSPDYNLALIYIMDGSKLSIFIFPLKANKVLYL